MSAPTSPDRRPAPLAGATPSSHRVGTYGPLVLPAIVAVGIPAALLALVAGGARTRLGPEAATLLGVAALMLGAWFIGQAYPRRVTLSSALGGEVGLRVAVGPFGRTRTYRPGTITEVRVVCSRQANKDGTWNSFFRLELQPTGRPAPEPVFVCGGGASEGDVAEPPAALAALAADLAMRLGVRVVRVREVD